MAKNATVFQPNKPKTGGRAKGTPNKFTGLLKDAILEAATLAGGKDGLVGYLRTQATKNPAQFLVLLGKVMPVQLTGAGGGPLQIEAINAALSRMPEKDVAALERILHPLAATARVTPGSTGGGAPGASSTQH